MSRTNKDRLFQQRHIPIIGVVKQLLGGAMTWVTMLIFLFSGISAWNTSTMDILRSWFPWMNLGLFIAVIVIGLVFAMWLEHKWIQPSVMAYWNQMFYDHNNPMKEDQLRVERKVDFLIKHLLSEDTQAHLRRELDEITTKK